MVQSGLIMVQSGLIMVWKWFNHGSKWFNHGPKWFNHGSKWFNHGSKWAPNKGPKWVEGVQGSKERGRLDLLNEPWNPDRN